jgi:hypothetical protein
MADTGARVSTMAKRRLWIPTPPQFTTCLHGQNTCEGHAGCLARLPSFYSVPWRPPNRKRG